MKVEPQSGLTTNIARLGACLLDWSGVIYKTDLKLIENTTWSLSKEKADPVENKHQTLEQLDYNANIAEVTAWLFKYWKTEFKTLICVKGRSSLFRSDSSIRGKESASIYRTNSQRFTLVPGLNWFFISNWLFVSANFSAFVRNMYALRRIRQESVIFCLPSFVSAFSEIVSFSSAKKLFIFRIWNFSPLESDQVWFSIIVLKSQKKIGKFFAFSG